MQLKNYRARQRLTLLCLSRRCAEHCSSLPAEQRSSLPLSERARQLEFTLSLNWRQSAASTGLPFPDRARLLEFTLSLNWQESAASSAVYCSSATACPSPLGAKF